MGDRATQLLWLATCRKSEREDTSESVDGKSSKCLPPRRTPEENQTEKPRRKDSDSEKGIQVNARRRVKIWNVDVKQDLRHRSMVGDATIRQRVDKE